MEMNDLEWVIKTTKKINDVSLRDLYEGYIERKFGPIDDLTEEQYDQAFDIIDIEFRNIIKQSIRRKKLQKINKTK